MASTQPAEYMGMKTAGRVLAEWDAVASSLEITQTPEGSDEN
jgi:hypothetical protein